MVRCMRPSETLSKRLVDARAEQGLRQSDVAQRATELGHPLDRGTVAKIERGERRVTVDDAAAFAEVLGVPLGYLLGAEEETTDEEGVELRFEVTVKLLPSREEVGGSAIRGVANSIIDAWAEKQGGWEAVRKREKAQTEKEWEHVEESMRGASEKPRTKTRLTVKDAKVPSKMKLKDVKAPSKRR